METITIKKLSEKLKGKTIDYIVQVDVGDNCFEIHFTDGNFMKVYFNDCEGDAEYNGLDIAFEKYY